MKLELLSPAGNMERLKIAFYYGADAVYLAGKRFGLRASADNFTNSQLKKAFYLAKKLNKKVYVAVNIVAHNKDFVGLIKYLKFLEEYGADGVIVSDLGVASVVRNETPKLDIHVSTQANVTNSLAALTWVSLGAKRIVLARELSFEEIKTIRKVLPREIELEAFVHGAMCIAHSGRCLLSNVLVGRDANAGACVQACRFQYNLVKTGDNERLFPIEEDIYGTYILNSKDLCMINYLKELIQIGVCSFKIEGRMKSDYYVANITNAYRRALDSLNANTNIDFIEETKKSSHREYTTGFYVNDEFKTNLKSSGTTQTYDVVANVLSCRNGFIKIEQRNKFCLGDKLEILSPSQNFLKTFTINSIINSNNESLESAKIAGQVLFINCPFKLNKYDMLRKKK